MNDEWDNKNKNTIPMLILHALELEEQYYYRSIRSEIVIVDYHNDLFPDVKTFSNVEKVTQMAPIRQENSMLELIMVQISYVW